MFSSWRGAEDPSRTSGPLTKRRSAALSTPPRPRPPPLGGRRARHLAKGRTQPAGRRSLQPTGESYAVPGRKEWRATAKSRAAPQAAQPPRAGEGAAGTAQRRGAGASILDEPSPRAVAGGAQDRGGAARFAQPLGHPGPRIQRLPATSRSQHPDACRLRRGGGARGGAAPPGGTDLSGRGTAAIGVHRPLSVIDTRWHGERDGGRERDTIRGGPDET